MIARVVVLLQGSLEKLHGVREWETRVDYQELLEYLSGAMIARVVVLLQGVFVMLLEVLIWLLVVVGVFQM